MPETNTHNQNKNVLIIEDDAFLARASADKFQHEGFIIQIATNGQEGLDCMRSDQKPSLVLLDLMMPVKNGFEVMEEMRADQQLSHIPVVVLSNLSQPTDIEKSKALGACDFMVKANVPLKEVVSRSRVCMVG